MSDDLENILKAGAVIRETAEDLSKKLISSRETIKVLRAHLFNVVSQLEAVKTDKDIDVASAKAALLATAKEGKC